MLLITIDTLRADAVGAYGRAGAATPRMDRLAASGMRFDQARAHNVVTLPSHANILSGRLPIDHGVRDNAGFRFPAAPATLATILKAQGYRTGAFVSAFPLDSRFGLDRGFDVYDDAFVGARAPQPFLVQERAAVETVARARQWLDAQGDAPVLGWVHLYEPHYPYEPPAHLAAKFPSRPYDGEVAAADEALGPLLDPLFAAGAAARTLVVLTSDHGESLDEHGEATHGIFAYEPVLRVPLIVYGPGLVQPGTSATAAGHVDVLPTILDVLGIDAPRELAGRSLVSAAARDESSSRDTYFEAMSGALHRGWAPLRGLVSAGVKFVDLPVPELYDLAADPQETRNLAADQPARAEAMRRRLATIPSAPVTPARSESADTRDRLRSLGYLAASAAPKAAYTKADDPKNLIALDRLMQDVVGRYLDGDIAGALERCRELVRRRPEMAVSLLYLAQLERESGRLDAAIAALEQAAALSRDAPDALSLLGAYLTEGGRAADAVRRLRAHAGAEGADVAVLVSYALAQARSGSTAAALETLGRARQADPSNAMLHVHQGTVRLMGNDRAGAREEFGAALRLAPDAARAHSSLGVMAAEDGDVAGAIEHWKRAVAADPREHRTIFGVGRSLAERGRPAAARPYFAFFAASAPRGQFRREVAVAERWLAETR